MEVRLSFGNGKPLAELVSMYESACGLSMRQTPDGVRYYHTRYGESDPRRVSADKVVDIIARYQRKIEAEQRLVELRRIEDGLGPNVWS